MIVPPCPSSAQVRQELQTGGGANVVPIPSGGASCGNDPFSNYNYTAQVYPISFPPNKSKHDLFPSFSLLHGIMPMPRNVSSHLRESIA